MCQPHDATWAQNARDTRCSRVPPGSHQVFGELPACMAKRDWEEVWCWQTPSLCFQDKSLLGPTEKTTASQETQIAEPQPACTGPLPWATGCTALWHRKTEKMRAAYSSFPLWSSPTHKGTNQKVGRAWATEMVHCFVEHFYHSKNSLEIRRAWFKWLNMQIN